MADPYQGKGGPTDPVLEETDDFSGGLVTIAPPHLLETKQVSDCRNVMFTRPFGAATTRFGYSTYLDLSTPQAKTFALDYTAAGVYGATASYIHAGATVGGHVGSLFEKLIVNGYTYAATSGSTKGEDWRFSQFNSLMLAVNPFEPTLKYVNPNWTALLGGPPPANVRVIATHRGRVWLGNTSAGTSRVHFSALNNAEDWTTANDAGFIDVSPGDGDFITGLVSLNSVLIIFKKNSTWAVTGGGPTSFVLKLVSGTIGCINDRTIARGDQFAIFLSHSGIYNVTANANGVLFVNYNIKPSIDFEILGESVFGQSNPSSFLNSSEALCAGGRWKTEYWLSKYDNSVDGSKLVYVFDFVFGTFTIYDNMPARQFITDITGELLGLQTDYKVYQYNQAGVVDPGNTTINWYITTKEHDFGSWVNSKVMHDLIIQYRAISGIGQNAITLSYLVGGSSTAFASFTPPNLNTLDRLFYKQQVHFPDSAYTHYVKFKISGAIPSGTVVPVSIYGYSTLAEIYERENG